MVNPSRCGYLLSRSYHNRFISVQFAWYDAISFCFGLFLVAVSFFSKLKPFKWRNNWNADGRSEWSRHYRNRPVASEWGTISLALIAVNVIWPYIQTYILFISKREWNQPTYFRKSKGLHKKIKVWFYLPEAL